MIAYCRLMFKCLDLPLHVLPFTDLWSVVDLSLQNKKLLVQAYHKTNLKLKFYLRGNSQTKFKPKLQFKSVGIKYHKSNFIAEMCLSEEK